MDLSECLIYTTIRIETITHDGMSCTGTGFFFDFCEDKVKNIRIPTIVTNKHVIRNAKTGILKFSLSDKDGTVLVGKTFDCTIDNFETHWILHPEENIDLCVLPISILHNNLHSKYPDLNLHYRSLSKDLLPTPEDILSFSMVEDITMIGYPDGIWDSINNIPIARKGITATPIKYDFEGQAKFLIDSAVYGGSSGSPVFIFNQGSYSIGNTLYAGSRLKLIGINYAVAQHTVEGDICIKDIPVTKTPIPVTRIPNNLGVVIKSHKLLDFECILDSSYK